MLRTIISLPALEHNARQLAQLVAPAQVMAVVKANAYNHGIRVVHALETAGINQFGVATIPEALELLGYAANESGLAQLPQVTAWIWQPETELGEAVAAGVQLGVPSLAHLPAVFAAANELIHAATGPDTLKVFVMVDTGLNRSGIDLDDLPQAFTAIKQAQEQGCPVEVLGLFSHFACADERNHPSIAAQLQEYEQALAIGRDLGFALDTNTFANSPATLSLPEAHYQLVRPGLALYGLNPFPSSDEKPLPVALKPAMRWEATITAVKPIAAGDSVSYSHTWTAPKAGYTAIVPCGYADGLFRSAQNLEIAVKGRRYKQVGRVCMDQVVIWLEDNPAGVKPGDTAIIFGSGQQGEWTATQLADHIGTINYEVICAPTGRTRRIYTNEFI